MRIIYFFFLLAITMPLAEASHFSIHTNGKMTSLVYSIKGFTQQSFQPETHDSLNRYCAHLHSFNRALESLYFHFDSDKFDWADSEALARDLFKIRTNIKDRINELDKKSKLENFCVLAFRNLIGLTRRLEEVTQLKHPSMNKARVALAGSFPQVEWVDSHNIYKFQSGDILLSRGESFLSAAISRIGDYNGSFSHAAMIYQHPDSAEFFVIESKIEHGLTVTPLAKFRLEPRARLAVYRYKDSLLASAAAEIMFNKWIHSEADEGKKINYDFHMNDGEENEFFCSELVSYSLNQAAAARHTLIEPIPTFKTHIDHRKSPFLRSLGIEFDDVFTPDDIEIDPHFQLLGEWRNPNLLKNIKNTDLVMQAMFDWMIEYGYQFSTDVRQSLIAVGVISFGMAFQGVIEVANRVPPNINSEAIATIFNLEHVGNNILREVENYEASDMIKSRDSVSDKYILSYLYVLRILDLQKYQENPRKKTIFHENFHAKK